jgi:Glycosyltransferase 61
MLVKRLLHSAKVVVGQILGKILYHLSIRGKGSVSRLHRVLLTSQTSVDYSSRILIHPTTLQFSKPQFFIEGSNAEKYLEMLADYGSKSIPASGIISANNVNVSFPLGMHLLNEKIFEEALLGTELLTNPKYFLDVETIPFRKKTFSSEAILLSLPWYHNFFHWMIEILPRLALYDLAVDLHHLRLVVPRSAPKFIRESLNLTGYEDKVYFIEDGVYRFEKLHILSRLADTADISPFAIDWLNSKVKTSNIETSKKRIYVSRADAKIRFVTNELEVQNLLSNFGFESVTMTHYSLEEQIRIFQQAEVVVGSHGAAFAHIAFMAPQAIFIEFFESGHFNRCFYRMACLKRLRYGFLVGQKNGLGFSVDIAQLESLLKQALP